MESKRTGVPLLQKENSRGNVQGTEEILTSGEELVLKIESTVDDHLSVDTMLRLGTSHSGYSRETLSVHISEHS
jgi:hypothetical protein